MTQLGKYEILEEIGRGGFGVVYRTVDTALKVERALKVLHPTLVVDPHLTARFIREAQVAAGLEHPHIVPVYDVGEVEGRIYLAMKYMPGGSLKERLAAQGKLALPQAIEITRQVCAGLDFAHQRQIVHRDLKPGNILFDENGGVRVSDFGFAKVLSETASTSFTMSGGILGTPAYMAPELWNGTPPPSPATDVYALACVLYEMITGEVLFGGETPSTVMLKHFQPVPDLDQKLYSYPIQIKQAIEKALSKDPPSRYQGANNFIEAITQTQKYKKSDKLTVRLSEDLTMSFVHIPAGEFWMGSDDEDAQEDEKPMHKVYLNEYWIGLTPVTNQQYQIYCKDAGKKYRPFLQRRDYPVINVSWFDSNDFCNWLVQKTKRLVRLPTEAEWEKAARGLDKRNYPWGNESPNCNLANYVQCLGRGASVTSHPDGASPYGVLDMAGNVWEWVNDWYAEDYYNKSPEHHPEGPESGNYRVLRGGSWDSYELELRVWYRYGGFPDDCFNNYGFRCLLVP
jgi:serine/threonine protein kinase